MAPPDQGSGGASPPAAAALRRQTSCTCTCSGYEPPPPKQHERRRLSSAASFSSPAASPAPSSASTADSSYHPAPSHKSSSCESIPFANTSAVEELGLGSNKLSPSVSSASSSSSSYESFLHIDPDCLDFDEPSPAMTAAAYDPKRLPSAMFRTRSTNPAEWSVTSNDSLFSIQLSSCSSGSGAGSARYGDVIYYDAAAGGFPSMGMTREPSSVSSSGGLCLREDCARCNGTGSTVRKAVRFAATAKCVSSGDGNRSAGLPTANATAASTANNTPEAAAAGWCQFACCWPALPTLWWPRCCAWNCHCCGGCWC